MYKITTVMGIPGAGKSTYCRERAYKGIGLGEGHWRPEPTEDIDYLLSKFQPSMVQEILACRFRAMDTQVLPSQFRDSDVFTSRFIFSWPELLSALDYGPLVSDELVWIQPTQKVLQDRILQRARPGEHIQEAKYFTNFDYWMSQAQKAYDLHPAKVKRVISVT
jgi:hypothetical protein